MPKIVVVGDSTVSSFNDISYYYPRYGYGVSLDKYFKLEVINLALSGRSSKSFLVEKNYNKMQELLNDGDYLIIGFGHNDEKDDDIARFASAKLDINTEGSFKNILYNSYIKLAKDKGATPIICTPVPRLDFSNKYEGNTIHINKNGDYRKTILDLGLETNTLAIDLTMPLVKESLILGENQVYLHAITKGMEKDSNLLPNITSVDKTHLSYFGSMMVAYLFAKAINDTSSSLKEYIYNLDKPELSILKMNPEYKFKKYITPDLDNYKPGDNFKCAYPLYGTAFGTLGAKSDRFIAKGDIKDKVLVGTYEDFGKINASNDGIAYAFIRVDKTKNFKISANAKVVHTNSVRQAGFGLMLRGDSFINQEALNENIETNYIASGFLTTDKITYMIFARPSYTELNKENNTFDHFYNLNDTAKLSINRLGQVVNVSLEYEGKVYKKDYIDFDILSIDPNYLFIGMFSTNGTVVEFSDINFEITGNAKEA